MALKSWQTKLIGVGMMIPLVILAIILILNKALWIYVILGAVFGYMFNMGFKLVQGAQLSDIRDRIVDDIEDAREDAQDGYDRVRGKD